MSAYLQTLARFRTSTSLTAERVLSDGQKLMHTASATVEAARPNKLRARMWSARSEREILYDGKTVTLYAPAQKYYSTVEFSVVVPARTQQEAVLAPVALGLRRPVQAGRLPRSTTTGPTCGPTTSAAPWGSLQSTGCRWARAAAAWTPA